MKIKNKMIMAALAAAAFMAGGQAMAATTTASMTVSLTNVASASVSTTPIAFGNISAAAASATATGTITVNVTSGAPYTISLDGGLHANTSGICRSMAGTGVSRRYQTYANVAQTQVWGDSDTANSCAGTTSNGGQSKPGTGTGANQVLTVHAKAWGGTGLGAMSDTLTVTVAY